MEATVSDFYDALKVMSKGYSAFSCNGVNLFGDRDSIKTAVNWEHRAHQVDFFQKSLIAEKDRADRLHDALLALHNDCLKRIDEYPTKGEGRKLYEQVCVALYIEPGAPGAPIPKKQDLKFSVGIDGANPNNRRIHLNHTGFMKVYGWSPEQAQARADFVLKALEAYDGDFSER